MTKERLEELIEQRATIWYDGHFEIKLNPEQYLIAEAFGKTVLWYQPKDKPSGYDWSWELDVLREDIDRAKWEHNMFAERTERFEPPMWEDIEKDGYLFTFIKPKDIRTIAFAVNWGVLWENEIVILYDDEFYDYDDRIIFNETATKENYEKACEIVRDLFKGEK